MRVPLLATVLAAGAPALLSATAAGQEPGVTPTPTAAATPVPTVQGEKLEFDLEVQVPDAPARPVRTPRPSPTPSPSATPSATPEGGVPEDFDALRTGAPEIPSLLLERFRIPPFLLPIYQAAGVAYDVPWEVLAAINEIETDFGRNLTVSSAGAVGWMQFMPATWLAYGVDGNGDGIKDPYHPVDAIFAAARYLRASGAQTDLKRAIFAYNHADWYVADVVEKARYIAAIPLNVVNALTTLAEARFPVRAQTRYAAAGEAGTRQGANLRTRSGAAVIAVNDGRVVRIGESRRLGRYLVLADDAGNHFTYGQLGSVAETYLAPAEEGDAAGVPDAPRRRAVAPGDVAGPAPREIAALRGRIPFRDRADAGAATPADQPDAAHLVAAAAQRGQSVPPGLVAAASEGPPVTRAAPRIAEFVVPAAAAAPAPAALPPEAPEGAAPLGAASVLAVSARKERLFANPTRLRARRAGATVQLSGAVAPVAPAADTVAEFVPAPLHVSGGAPPASDSTKAAPPSAAAATPPASRLARRTLRVGSSVLAGTVLGRAGSRRALRFEIRPAGRGAPRVDPTPLLDSWRLLEDLQVRRGTADPFSAAADDNVGLGRLLLLPRARLQRAVLADPRIDIYACGRQDLAAGVIDRRVLVALASLAAGGLHPTVSSLRCGHGRLTASGNVSDHTSGNAVDIAALNGVPVLGHQGPDSLAERAVRRVLTLQGALAPRQVISLIAIKGEPRSLAMADHHDHLHIGFEPASGTDGRAARQAAVLMRPGQWRQLISRLRRVENPRLRGTEGTGP